MNTKERGSEWATWFRHLCQATENHWRTQQDLMRKYAGQGVQGGAGPAWRESVERMQQQWSSTMSRWVGEQRQAVHLQFRAAQAALDALWGPTDRFLSAPSRGAAETEAPSGGATASADSRTRESRIVAIQTAAEPRVAAEAEAASRPKGSRNMNIAERVAVVTGAASGIGEATARQLAERGAKAVLLVDRSERVKDLASSIDRDMGRSVAEGVVGDTTDAAFRARVFENAASQHGVISICVPAAGITRDALAVRLDKETGKAHVFPQETFQLVTEVNLIAPIYWALEMVARIAEDRRRRGLGRWEPVEEIEGTVVFLGSVSSQGNKGQIAYAVAKAGLEGAAATLSKEAIFHGVRCAIIHPGFTDTPMVRALGEEYVARNVLPYTQLRRLIRPEEIADAICFMISNAAVSGELWADAGWHPPA